MSKKHFAIVVGGGPAPGINGVIAAATIEARNRGYEVYGILKGFSRLSEGDSSCIIPLSIADVSRIDCQGGSVLLTSRANPRKNPEHLATVVRLLQEKGIGYLITIGGDDTASSAQAVATCSQGSICVTHVPKTIDNDLPLPSKDSTFGFQTAREVGVQIVDTLMLDAKTTGRWYFVVAMGRKAGHLALGIGVAAGATLTIIPEDFPDKTIPMAMLVDRIVGTILKRLVSRQGHGVVVLAEGLAEKVDAASIPELAHAERDPFGNIRYAEVDFGPIIRNAVRKRLEELGVKKLTIVDKNVGYELRCREPLAFDREYTRQLGFGAVDFLANGGNEAMITRQGDKLVPIPFSEMIDSATGATNIRTVDTESPLYAAARKYMIILLREDLEDAVFVKALNGITQLPESKLIAELSRYATGN